MGLRDTIIAGQIAELDRIRLEGKSAVDSAYREWQVIRQQLIHELENLDACIAKYNETIKDLQARVVQAQNALKTAQAALQAAQAKLSSSKDKDEQRAAASEVAKCAADVKTHQDKCTQIFSKLKDVTQKRNELMKSRDSLMAAIKRVDTEGAQNYRDARSRYEEACVSLQNARNMAKSYPGGY